MFLNLIRQVVFKYFLCSLYIVFSLDAFAINIQSIKSDIDKQLHKSNAGDLNIGIYLENLDTGKVKFSLHSNRLFIPASLTKVFTGYMALKYLGPGYRIPTNFIADKANIKHKKLRSDLYIQFHGDPTLTYEDLVSSLKSLGINTIYGDVVIDDNFFDDHHTSPGGFVWDDNPFYYAAPKSAVIIDNNTSEAWMKPSNTIGGLAQLRIDRPYVLDIVNNVETVRPRKYDCPYKSRYISDNRYEVYGCMFNNMSKDIRLNFALQDTKLMSKKYVEQAIKDSHIKLHGSVKIGKAGKGNMLYQHLSLPLKEFLSNILADSSNITSGALFKYMAALNSGQPGSDENGEALLKKYLEKIGISNKDFYLRDGSGESRYNLVSPKAVVQLLSHVYHNHKIREYFINSLSQYGIDGTLRYRSINGNYGKFIYAKTGTFKGVSTLAGYYLPKQGSKYAFAIMSNNSRMSWSEAKNLEDNILYILLKH